MPLSYKIIDDVQQKISRTTHVEHHFSAPYLIVSILHQYLYVVKEGSVLADYCISTALNGIGNCEGSGKTPLGLHRIAEKIGADAQLGSIFKARCEIGKIAPIRTAQDGLNTMKNECGKSDNITSRILWLDGLEEGKNKGGSIDTYRRYIYIHGTDEEWCLGKPVSHGCIRMANKDIIQLFNEIIVDSLVVIIK